MYDDIPDKVRTKYSEVALQDIHGLVSIGGIAQFAREHDIAIADVEMDEYREWSVIYESGGIGGVGEDQFEWAVEELLDPDSTYDTEEARHLFQILVNERLEARDAHRE
jgi:hypothetical protein